MKVSILQWMCIENLKNISATRHSIETCMKYWKKKKEKERGKEVKKEEKSINPRINTCSAVAFIPYPMHQPGSLVVFTPFYHFATCHVPFRLYWQTDSQRKEGFVYRQFWLSENGLLSNVIIPTPSYPATLNLGRKGAWLCMCRCVCTEQTSPWKSPLGKSLTMS